MYYKVLISWTSQKVKDTYATRNAFDYKNVCSFERSYLDAPGPCVLFATPGMISGGLSLEVFQRWAPCEKNLVTLPGYCVAGTVGHKLMSGKPSTIDVDNTQIDVRCQIHQLSFSPHTDAKGIMDLIKFLSPKHVVLVHGEGPKMAKLKERIESELGMQCYHPANLETISISSTHHVKADASDTFIHSSLTPNFKFLKGSSVEVSGSEITPMSPLQVCDERVAEGILTMRKGQNEKIIHQDELLAMLGAEKHEVQFSDCCAIHVGNLKKPAEGLSIVDKFYWIQVLYARLSDELAEVDLQHCQEYLKVDSIRISLCTKESCPHISAGASIENSHTVYFDCRWSAIDEKIAWKIISTMKNLDLN